HKLLRNFFGPRQRRMIVREILEVAVAVALRNVRRLEALVSNAVVPADAWTGKLAAFRSLDDPFGAAAMRTGGVGCHHRDSSGFRRRRSLRDRRREFSEPEP